MQKASFDANFLRLPADFAHGGLFYECGGAAEPQRTAGADDPEADPAGAVQGGGPDAPAGHGECHQGAAHHAAGQAGEGRLRHYH